MTTSASHRISARLVRELEVWHGHYGFDFARMIEEKPELYQRLLKQPEHFKSTELGRDYCRLIKLTVGRAEKNDSYKAAFKPLRDAESPKDQISVGRVMVAPEMGKKRNPK